jgi:hypothetical protein
VTHGRLGRKATDDVWAYELEATGAFETSTEQSRTFVMARCQTMARFTMDLWYTA